MMGYREDLWPPLQSSSRGLGCSGGLERPGDQNPNSKARANITVDWIGGYDSDAELLATEEMVSFVNLVDGIDFKKKIYCPV